MELSIGVDGSTFTCIEGGALHHACGLEGWVADHPLRC